MRFKDEHIWLIGASTGIGAALATQLAEEGAVLALSSRRKEALENLEQGLKGKHYVYPLDVSSHQEVQEATQNVYSDLGKIDRILFLAALYEPSRIEDFDMTSVKRLLDVNLLGAMYVTHAILEKFREQKSGQIVLCASVAGYTGLPGGQPYSASKAGLINFAESLHTEVEDFIDVKVICPGFVRTPLTAKNNFVMPMMIEAEEASRAIVRGLKSRRFEISFPKGFTLLVKLLKFLPYGLRLGLLKKMGRKSGVLDP